MRGSAWLEADTRTRSIEVKIGFLLRVVLRLALSMLLSVAEGRGQAATVSDPGGTWLTEDGRARVRLERCGAAPERICGYVVWMKELVDSRGQPFRDRLNPDPAKRPRALLGHQILLGLKPTADGRYAGEVYNAEDGKTYGVSVWRDSPGRLAVKGCLLGLFCATQSWTQTRDAAPGQLLGPTGDPTGPVADPEWAAPRLPAATAAKTRAR
ncbi:MULTISPECIES: DUF2147 domain-containing protein [unclassified Bradyrhizobium]|uniref:DUF2147 domain-containing protein n=1 Tax=unclassified Bradyrhizobium TaxID=2631580 RepID=UPI0029162136|nr:MULTISPECIES: DUF2147 domain-containing protein [unclassified Bradyrhizobium]